MRITLTLLFAFLAHGLSAQYYFGPTFEQELINEAGARRMSWNTMTPYGNDLLIGGQSSGPGGLGMYLARYQNGSTLVWDTVFSAGQPGSVNHILPGDSLGNWYAIGAQSLGGSGELEIRIQKFSPANKLLWSRSYRGPANQFAYATDARLEGGFLYLCGQQQSAGGGEESFVAKFDLKLTLIWHKAFQPGVSTYFGSLIVDGNGQITAVGSADFAASFLAVRFDPGGNIVWQYPSSLTGSGTAYLADAVADDQGNVYAIGTRESGVFESDIVTLKLAPTGNLVWERIVNNQDENEGRIIQLAPNGQICSAGNLSNGALAFLTQYDTAGNVMWTNSFQLGFQPLVSELVMDPAGGVFVGVEDVDSVGVVRIEVDGSPGARVSYGLEVANYLSGAALLNGTLWVAGDGNDDSQGALIGLQPATLSENSRTLVSGGPLSDVRAGSITANESPFWPQQFTWMGTYSDDGDSAEFSVTKFGSTGTVLWTRTIKEATVISDFPYLVHDGNDQVIGLYQNSQNVGGGIMGLVKYDASGNQLFLTKLGGPELLKAGGLVIDPAGNLFVVASDDTNREMVLFKISPAGLVEWSVRYKSPATLSVSVPLDMKRTPQGKLVIAASHRGLSDDNELHLFQYSDAGVLEWQADVANQPGNLASLASMTVLPNGDIVILGGSTILQYAAARFSSTGTRLWLYEGSNPPTAAPRSLFVNPSEESYLFFSSNGAVIVRQLASDGSFLQEKQFAISSSSGTFYFPRYAFGTVNNNIAVLGDHLLSGNRSVPFQMSMSADLQELYTEEVNPERTAQIEAALMVQDEILAAYTSGDLSGGSGPRTALLRAFEDGPVSIGEELQQSLFRVFPNPANQSVTLINELPGHLEVFLTDLQGRRLGKTVQLQAGPGEQTEMTLPEGIAPGTYLLGISHEHGTVFQRLVIN